MSIEDQYSYYSKHFDVICALESYDEDGPAIYKLSVLLNPGPGIDDGPVLLEVRDNLSEDQLDQVLEELKEKTYLTLEL
jgi:hypothetical protein